MTDFIPIDPDSSTLATSHANDRRRIVLVATVIVAGVLVNVLQNLKWFAEDRSLDKLRDQGPVAIIWMIVATIVAGVLARLGHQTMNRSVAILLASAGGACSLIASAPVVGAGLGLATGILVVSSRCRRIVKTIIFVGCFLAPMLVVGALGAAMWRDLEAPTCAAGPAMCVLFLLGVFWLYSWLRHHITRMNQLRGTFHPVMLTLWLMCAVCLWLGLTLDTYRRASPVYPWNYYGSTVGFHSNGPDILVNGLLDINQVYGKLSDEDLKRFRAFKNIRDFGFDENADFSGTGLNYLMNPTSVRCLYLRGTRFTNEGARALSRFTGVTYLDLNDTKITDDALAHLKPMSRLLQLDLSSTNISGEGLVHLAGIPSLSYLNVCQTRLTDAGLENLRLHPGLRRLDLSETQVTGAGVADVASGQLQLSLNMAKAAVTDATVHHLAALKKMPTLTLDLSNNAIGDAALVHVGKLTNLTHLGLAGTNITDEGLTQLTNLSALIFLDVSNTQCTEKGVAALERTLPNVEVMSRSVLH